MNFKTFLSLVFLAQFAIGQTQKPQASLKELSLNDAVRKQYRDFRPDDLGSPSWIPGTEEFVYAADGFQTLKKSSTKSATESDFLKIADVNTALGAKLPYFFGYSWKSATELYLSDGMNFYVYNTQTKKGSSIVSLQEGASNQVQEPTTGNVAYTIENNLFVHQANGKASTVTNNSDKFIVSGQAIARSEFGITGGIFWSPKGNHLAFYQKNESKVAEYPLLDITTTPGSLRNIRYPMTGQPSENPRVGIYNLSTKQTVYINPRGASDDYLTNLSWTPDEKYVLIAEVNRDQDKMELNLYDAISGAYVRTLFTETDTKWVEPEHPAFFPSSTSSNFIWISERDGFNNLYYYDITGKLIKQVTSFKFVVKDILTSTQKGKNIIFSATGASPLNTLYYTVDLNGKYRLLTIEEGTHSISLNEAGTYFIDQYSSHSVGGRSELKSISGKIVRNLVNSPNKLADYRIGTADIGQLKGKDGSVLYTRLIKPSNFDPNKKYPVLVYVYGGPHAQMITNSWLDGANLWMYWMAEQGYLVFTLDNRGSGERGKAFEQQVHRQLGTLEIEDQMTGVDYLKSLPYVDGERLAVHGWSFGGFMTTSLMLRQAGTFNVGVAGGPVTDWKYYEIMYGERYMDRPEQNKEGYEKSSLFTYAGNLKGDLLLIHGTVDDVVVMQHNYALVKKFVDLGIQMDFFPYPMHPHNVSGKDRVHLMTKVLNYVIENNK